MASTDCNTASACTTAQGVPLDFEHASSQQWTACEGSAVNAQPAALSAEYDVAPRSPTRWEDMTARRGQYEKRPPKGVSQGACDAAHNIGTGVCRGYRDLVTKPVEGAHRNGALGAVGGAVVGVNNLIGNVVYGAGSGAWQAARGVYHMPSGVVNTCRTDRHWDREHRVWVKKGANGEETSSPTGEGSVHWSTEDYEAKQLTPVESAEEKSFPTPDPVRE